MRAVVPVLLLAAASLGPARQAVVGYDQVVANDNRAAAGSVHGNVLTLELEARIGIWHPNGDHDSSAALPAFAEDGQEPRIPRPLVRVRAGTIVSVSLRNRLPNDTLLVHGLDDRVTGTGPAHVVGHCRTSHTETIRAPARVLLPRRQPW